MIVSFTARPCADAVVNVIVPPAAEVHTALVNAIGTPDVGSNVEISMFGMFVGDPVASTFVTAASPELDENR